MRYLLLVFALCACTEKFDSNAIHIHACRDACGERGVAFVSYGNCLCGRICP